MKKTIAILLLFAISLQTFSKGFLVLNFKLNQKEIASKYCENKAKPKLQCDGKCHLKKQLQKDEKKEKKEGPKESKEKYENQFFVEQGHSFNIQYSTFNILHFYSVHHSHSYSHAVFSPPKC